MENTLLVGLSRQTLLERQLDVVANNIANVNTTGYKADSSLFEEFLTSGAHEDNFVGADRRVSYVQDRATYRDFAQGAADQTKNPLDLAIDGSGFLVVQTPAGERYTRDGGLQLNNQGQLVTLSGTVASVNAALSFLSISFGDPVAGVAQQLLTRVLEGDLGGRITGEQHGDLMIAREISRANQRRAPSRSVSISWPPPCSAPSANIAPAWPAGTARRNQDFAN